MAEGHSSQPLWARPAFSHLLGLLFSLAFLWSVTSFIFYSWLAAAHPAREQPNMTLAMIYMVTSPIFLLAIFIVPILIRRMARRRSTEGPMAKR